MTKDREFISFTGATVEEALATDFGPESWYDCLSSNRKTPEGKKALWEYSLDWHYGISPETYHRLFEEQHGVCAICHDRSINRRLGIDHNHTTGAIRGLLCVNCNGAIGMFRESPELLDRAKDYLLKAGTDKNYSILRERREAHDTLFELQHGKCAICSEDKKLKIDHNHDSDKIRGLLCSKCNLGIGGLQDSVAIIDRAKYYLEAHAAI